MADALHRTTKQLTFDAVYKNNTGGTLSSRVITVNQTRAFEWECNGTNLFLMHS